MKSKTTIFNLIKSLDKEEYSFIKRAIAANKKENNLLKILHFYKDMRLYDEDVIKTWLTSQTFQTFFRQLENQLYDKIMSLMKSYSKNVSAQQNILNLLFNIEFLFRKKMFDECREQLEKAQKTAESLQLYEYQIFLFYWDFCLNATFLYDSGKKEKIPNFGGYLIYSERFIELVKNVFLESKITDQPNLPIVLKFDNETSGTTENINPYNNDRLNFYYHLMQGSIAFQEGNWQRSFVHYSKAEKLLEEAYLIESSADILPHLILIKLSVLLKQHNYKQFPETAQKAHELLKLYLNKKQQQQAFAFYNHKKHLYYLFTQQMQEADTLLEYIRKQYFHHKGHVNTHFLSNLAYQLAYHFFLKKEFDKSVSWIQEVWIYKKDLSFLIQHATRYLEIMLHFELKNYELLTSLSDALYRAFKKQNCLLEDDKAFVRFVKKYYYLDLGTQEAVEPLNELLEKFREHSGSEYQISRSGAYINIYSWCLSKLVKGKH
jgi:hypothetical protein